jgi:hypothetical protein
MNDSQSPPSTATAETPAAERPTKPRPFDHLRRAAREILEASRSIDDSRHRQLLLVSVQAMQKIADDWLREKASPEKESESP